MQVVAAPFDSYKAPSFLPSYSYYSGQHVSGSLAPVGSGVVQQQRQLPSSPTSTFLGANNHTLYNEHRLKLFGGRLCGIKRTAENVLPSPVSPIGNFHFGPLSPLTNEATYSRKVFVGGLPPDIDELEILNAFNRYGNLAVDWPHKSETKAHFPPKGYCFLIFENEQSVHSLMEACWLEGGKYYLNISSPSVRDKKVQIRPWCNEHADFVVDSKLHLDPRKTVFIGGVPRPLKACELAENMNRYFGGVCYAGVDTDADLRYPKGAGRVIFSNHQSYVAAIAARFIQLKTDDIAKKVEVKPFVLDDQVCDECHGYHCASRYAPYFCANLSCLQYYCEKCWKKVHTSGGGRECHKPMIKDTTERPKGSMGRWSMS